MGDDDRGAWRRRRLQQARLYVVTDAREQEGDLDPFLDAVLRGGADIIQLREKDAEAAHLVRAGQHFKEAARRHGALFIVNDRPDVALALDADGVHLGQDDVTASVARRILGPDAIIGISTHSPEQLERAAVEADYLCAGPVYPTPTKPGRPPTGLELIRVAVSRAKHGDELRPWFAIGGLDAGTLADVVAAGATRAVVVRAVGGDDAHAATAALRALLDAATRVEGMAHTAS